MELKMDIYQTVAIAVGVYYLGQFLKSKVSLFQKYCIPAPVIGGVIFATLALMLRLSGVLLLSFDTTLQGVFMNIFFTSVGFTASFKLIKKGGVQLFVFLGIVVALVLFQNVLGVALASILGLDPLMGLAVGSVPMVGGHATAGSFGPILESMGLTGASTITIAAATFGLVMGGIIGGPVARKRIKKHSLSSSMEFSKQSVAKDSEESGTPTTQTRFMSAFCQIFIAMGVGSVLYNIFLSFGITLPTYVGAMLIAALMRNLSDATHKYEIPEYEIQVTGNVCLALFLSMALMTLKLWELAELALPLIIMLLAQTMLMGLFAYFITFNLMGRDYEAAVLSSANCGFGLGATPNAIANMDAITSVFGGAPKAFFIVPLVGGLFVDFFNVGIITVFLNFISTVAK